MARRGGNGERREPVMGSADAVAELRLGPDDRPGAFRATMPDRPSRRTSFPEFEPEVTRVPKASRSTRGTTTGTRRKRGGRGFLARAFYWSLVAGIWVVLGVAGFVAYEASHLPAIQNLAIPERPPTVIIQGQDGKTIATRGDMRGAAIPLKALPPYLPKAFVAIEDRRFYDHFGLDVIGLARAVVVNLTAGRLREGGSTLSQQLAKNLFLTQDRTLSRKVQEVVLAIWLESKYSKDEILELYVNRVYFGAGAYGVEAAAQRYFGKPARQVTLSEAAMLAGLVKSPSALAPTRNLKAAQDRAALVLAAMEEAGFIDHATEQVALAHPATLAKKQGPDSSGYVGDWVMEQLEDKVGPIEGDITVQTSIDPKLQAAAEQALTETLNRSGAKFGVQQGAVVMMDTDGAVRALVGGRSYEDSQFNRAVTARRQPGSAFKPFVYLTAMERGLTPDTVREDSPLQLKGWKPENYSHEYRGPVTLETALAYSLNTVAVRLALEVGPAAVAKTATRLGIASKLDPNPSIALGTSEVSVLELTSAYAPFANGGIGVTPHVIERVRDAKGRVIYSAPGASRGAVMAPPHVAMMNRMLQQTIAIGTARKAELPGWPAAGKTGTSQDFRDAWFVGYTARYVTGVWLGNDDSSPTKKASGAGLPVEIWSRAMRVAHEGVPVAALPGMRTPSPYEQAVSGTEIIDEPVTTGATAPAGIPRPSAVVGGGAQGTGTIDNWLLDKLFGRN
ncbi:transglycosylase domain-containing protein [Ancylobacter terrae]|uniref:transglycosylase domain-containing protein n=1 Tax=Ancylobacter sp. sgz301288 TaxID=3342077 RepID=UPI0038596C40